MHAEALTKLIKWRGKGLFKKKMSNKGGSQERAPYWVTEADLYVTSLSQSLYTTFYI